MKTKKYIGLLSGLITIALYAWFIWPGSETSESTPARQAVDNNAIKTPLSNKRIPDRGVKFIKPEDIKIKPQENKSSLSSISGKIKTPTVSEKLQEELVEIRKNGYGSIPAVDTKSNLNPQKLSVIKALQAGDTKNLSSLGKRELFDKERYQNDPKAYIKEYMSTLSISRCFETAQPGEGIKVLKRASPQFVETYQNEPVELIVEGIEPNMIYSASVFDGGHFENDLSAITAQTDASGRGTLIFTPTEGVINNTRISVASPLSSGVVRFNVYVKKKREEK
jgi:hypothetical protein